MTEWNNGWNLKIEKIVHTQGVKSSFYKLMHENACSYYNKYDKIISIISIILVTLTATGSITTASMNNSMLYRVLIGIILYIIAFITAMKEFLNLTQITEKHRLYSMRFSVLYNNIQSQLALDILDRQDGSDYMGWINSEIDNLLFSNPTIPTKIKSNAENKFGDAYKEISTPLNLRMEDFKEEFTLIDIPEPLPEPLPLPLPEPLPEPIPDPIPESVNQNNNLRMHEDLIKRNRDSIQKERSIYELSRLSGHY